MSDARKKELDRNHEPCGINHLVLIDLDRTLLDTERCFEWLTKLVNEIFGLDPNAQKQAKVQSEASGESFDPLSYIQSEIEEEVFQAKYTQLEARFCESSVSLLFPDAVGFLDMMFPLPHVVMTYGNSLWQKLKIKACGFKGGFLVVGSPHKGRLIQQWIHNQSSGASFPQGVVICLIDDKLEAFEGLPDSCYGLLICRGEATQEEVTLPSRVEMIRSLDELAVVNGRVIRKAVD